MKGNETKGGHASIYDGKGGRTLELLIPFEHLGKPVASIHIRPVLFDHYLRWQQGEFPSSLALLASLCGERETTLRMLRYPDVDRVLAMMFEMLPEPIRADISNGQIPTSSASLPPERPRDAPEETVSEDLREEEGFNIDDAAE